MLQDECTTDGAGRRRMRRFLAPAFALLFCLTSTVLPSVATADFPETRIRVAFVGDSTADGLWGGISRLVSRDACLKNYFEFGRFARNGTGITRPDKFNWQEEVKKLGESFKPDLFVISLG